MKQTKETSSGIDPELRMPIEPIVGILAGLGVLVVFLSDFLADPSSRLSLALFAPLLYALVAVAWWLDGRKPEIGRWVTVVALVTIIHLASRWLDISEALVLTVMPIALAAPLINLRASTILAVIETLLLMALPHTVVTRGDGVIVGITLTVMWGILGVMYAIYRPAYQLGRRSWEYFEQAQALVTETRDHKVALAQSVDDLTHANRQLALANERLAALRAIAEEAQKTKVAFVAKVSHEFRTPLNMIVGLVGLLVESPELYGQEIPPAVLEDLRIVHRNCEHLSSMINDVLALSQAEAGHLTLYRERVDLAEMVDRALVTIHPLLEKKGLSLETAIPDDLPLIYCDRTRIRQVILNLVSNAARFTEEGGIKVDVVRRDQHVIVSVTDTGPGISPDDAERIFEPFCQGSDRLWRDKGGSGLGLSISKQLVELHSGRIWLESKPGIGTTFSFELPISSPIAHVAQPGHQIKQEWIWRERTSRADLPDSHYGPRVVLCDRTGDLYPALSRYSGKVELVDTRDLPQAIEELERCPAHAVVVNAPSLDDLWPWVERARQEMPETPIIGYAVPPRLEHTLKARAVDYLIKPVSRKDLERVIQAVGRPVRRVLVVDDDPDVLQLWTRMLHASDPALDVVRVSGGMEALDELHHRRPDLMLLDVLMPDISGWEILERKNRDEAIQDVPVVLVSAQDLISRPLSSEALLVSIGDGLSLGKLMACSLRVSELLLRPD
jgi:signal transduction histidine kinase/CheY-like chemotaxis protein